jgi:neutral ceramidase
VKKDPEQAKTLRAGVGRAEIVLPAELFPFEGFGGVHDALHARVLLLEGHGKVALVSIELTSLPEEQVAALQAIVAGEAGLPPENVWICMTHTFSAPHVVPVRFRRTPVDQDKNSLLSRAVESAVREATSQAVLGMGRARFGYGAGCCNVNVNRDVFTADGWGLGCNETGLSDKSVKVLRLETAEGDPIALLFTYAVQSSVMDEPPTASGKRLVSADLAGAACRFVEQEYGEAVTVLFCEGAAGDQAPSMKGARFQYVGGDGRIRARDVDARGFVVAEMLGARLGAEVLRVSEEVECHVFTDSVIVKRSTVRLPGQKIMETRSIRPTRDYVFASAEDRDEPVEIIRLGDVALVGVRPELCSQTGVSIKEKSPFAETLVLTMVNGSAKYMPDLSAYERISYEAMNSPFARGSAELLCREVLELLDDAMR